MLFDDYGDDELLQLLEKLINELESLEEQLGAEAVRKESRYSRSVTSFISSLEELRFYQDRLKLVESKVTRPCLTRKTISLSMCDADGVSNYDRMKDGRPPVVNQFDKEGLELHHMKQAYKGSFAELTPDEHARPGSGVVLHPKTKTGAESWRKVLERSHAFDVERAKYWIMRGEKLSEQR